MNTLLPIPITNTLACVCGATWTEPKRMPAMADSLFRAMHAHPDCEVFPRKPADGN